MARRCQSGRVLFPTMRLGSVVKLWTRSSGFFSSCRSCLAAARPMSRTSICTSVGSGQMSGLYG